MKDLLKREERKIVSTLERAVKYANAGETPTAALIKAAREAKLPMQSTQRMCEAFNTSKTVAYLKKTAGAARADSFPIVDTPAVLAAIWPKDPETPAKKAAAGLHPELVKLATSENFMEVKEPVTLPALVDKSPDPYDMDPGYMAKKAIDERNQLMVLLKDATIAYRDMFGRITPMINKAANYWRQAAQTTYEDFGLVEKRAFAEFGEISRPLMDCIVKSGNLDDRRIAVKRAGAEELGVQQLTWPEGEPYDAIANAVFFAKQATRLAKEVAAIDSTIAEHAIGKIDWLPPFFVEAAIDHMLPKEAKKDMPGFTEQDRPEKVKNIYRALKREHPGMPAEMKARISARQGKPGKQSVGPPYKAPLAKKESAALLSALFV